MKKSYNFLIIISITGLLSCNKDKGVPDDFDRGVLLVNYADNIIVPAYTELKTAIDEMKTSNDAFIATPNETNLNTLRTSWRKSLKAWQKVSYFDFGPAMDAALVDNSNLYPVDTTKIKSNISSGSYDLQTISNYPAKGFQTLDYLFYGIKKTDAEIVSTLNSTAHKNYIKALVDELHGNITNVNDTWKNTYSNTFKESTGTDVGSSLGMIVNAYNKHFEVFVRDGKIGIPAGARSFSGTPYPEKVEAYYAGDFSVELAIISIEKFKNIYLGRSDNGTNGIGLDDYLNHVEAKHNEGSLDAAIQNQFDAVLLKLNALKDPLKNDLVDNNAAAMSAFEEMQKLVILLKVDLPSALGILITYADNDGD